MSTWQDAPDASGLWWVRREGQPDDVLRVTRLDEHAVWINGTLCTLDAIRGWRWCRVVTPERVEALESAMREVCDAHRVELIGPPGLSGAACDWCYPGGGATREWPCANAECPVGRALAVLRGATVAAS